MAAPSALFPGVVIILDFVIPSLHGTIYQFFVFPGIRIKGQIFPSSLHLFAASLLSWSSHTLKHVASNKRFLLVDKENK